MSRIFVQISWQLCYRFRKFKYRYSWLQFYPLSFYISCKSNKIFQYRKAWILQYRIWFPIEFDFFDLFSVKVTSFFTVFYSFSKFRSIFFRISPEFIQTTLTRADWYYIWQTCIIIHEIVKKRVYVWRFSTTPGFWAYAVTDYDFFSLKWQCPNDYKNVITSWGYD